MFMCKDGWVRALGLGGYGINGRNEWRKLIFISRTYLINGIFICVLFLFLFFVLFRSLVIFDLSNLNLAQHVYSSPS